MTTTPDGQLALAVHAAAPDAELTLVRVDPSAMHQMLTVARQAAGESGASVGIQTRGIELAAESDDLARRRERVIEEYRQAFGNLSDDEGPARRREAAQKAVDLLRADERTLTATIGRYVALRTDLDRLAGTAVVVNTLVWEAGYPNDGLSAISRPSNASRKASGESVPCAVWLASDCTVASVFFTRWFSSSTKSFCRSSASLRSVMSCTTRTP